MVVFGNHFGFAARHIGVAAAVAIAWSSGAIPAASAQGAGVYKVAKVKTDVTAKDAVTAKKKALENARQRALRTLFKRVAPYSAYDRLPTVKTAVIDDMLENFLVRRERNSATQYLATLDYEFNAAAVRQLLSGYSIPYSDIQAARITVLPIYIDGEKVVSTGRDPWRKAWLELDLEHAVTPARLARAGSSLNREAVESILAGDEQAFTGLKTKYKAKALVLAVAQPSADKSRIETRLYGVDAAGAIALARSDRVYDGDPVSTARRAALVSLRILEERWKITQSIPEAAGADTAQRPVILTVEFGSLKQWQEIRARLAKIPGIQAMEISSLSARSADVTFRYPGGAQRLSGRLSSHNMVLSNVGGDWILRSN